MDPFTNFEGASQVSPNLFSMRASEPISSHDLHLILDCSMVPIKMILLHYTPLHLLPMPLEQDLNLG